MNKKELVSILAERCSVTNAKAAEMLDALLDAVTEALRKGDDVRLLGFGSFAVSERAASEGTNPKTGEKIAIKASRQPKFKPGKALKDAINP